MAEADDDGPWKSLWLYRNLPSNVHEDETLVLPTRKPDKFISSFVKQHIPNNRKKEMENIMKHKEMIMDTVKLRRGGKKKKTKQEVTGAKALLTKRRGKKTLSAREKKKMKLFDIPLEQQKYQLYEPLHQLWLDYMRDCLQTHKPNMLQLQARLLKCDLHGSLITVTRSKCPSYVGTSGILLQESKNVFKIITKDNQLKTIPKSQCWFMFTVDQFAVTIYGNHFCLRTGMRSAKKFKSKPTVDL